MTQLLNRLDVVTGDCEQIDLAMSDEDRKKVIENITLMYHFAATVRFDEKMKKAVEMNVRGTRDVIKLALECKHLEMFGHMSTAYCHLHVPFLLEKVRKFSKFISRDESSLKILNSTQRCFQKFTIP